MEKLLLSTSYRIAWLPLKHRAACAPQALFAVRRQGLSATSPQKESAGKSARNSDGLVSCVNLDLLQKAWNTGLEKEKWKRENRKTKQRLYLYKSWHFKDIWTAKEAKNINQTHLNYFSSICLSLNTKGNRKSSRSLYILLWNVTLPHHVAFKCFLWYTTLHQR